MQERIDCVSVHVPYEFRGRLSMLSARRFPAFHGLTPLAGARNARGGLPSRSPALRLRKNTPLDAYSRLAQHSSACGDVQRR